MLETDYVVADIHEHSIDGVYATLEAAMETGVADRGWRKASDFWCNRRGQTITEHEVEGMFCICGHDTAAHMDADLAPACTECDCGALNFGAGAAFTEPRQGTYENPRSNECSHGQRWGCRICDPVPA